MNNQLTKYLRIYKSLILFWTAFIGVGAVVGSCMFFFDPNEGFIMGEILPQLHDKMPLGDIFFSNFIFSGIALLICNGISNLSAFYLIIKNKRIGYKLGFIFGIILMLWICIQFYVFGPKIYLIDVIFFIFGLLQMICGLLAYVSFRQVEFNFKTEDYPNIGLNKDSKSVVVYFSRMGYTKKKAYEKANELKCDVIEIKALEKISNIVGFWWCGRFAMHQWEMPIEINIDITKYDHIYLYSPVWAFSIAAPTRAFINKYQNQINNLHLTLVHFINISLKNCFKEAEEKLNTRLVEKHEISSHFGEYKQIY